MSGVPIALPDDDILTGDLTAPHWREVSGGKIQLEPKDGTKEWGIRQRLGRSTDYGDAVVMAYAYELLLRLEPKQQRIRLLA